MQLLTSIDRLNLEHRYTASVYSSFAADIIYPFNEKIDELLGALDDRCLARSHGTLGFQWRFVGRIDSGEI